MTADTFRLFLKRQPFQPFKVHMNDGRSLEVAHPDFVLLPPGWKTTAIIAMPKGLFDFVYIRNVTSIESEGELPATPDPRPREGSSE